MQLMEASFAELIEGIRRGDADAAARLVREYEPEIRRAVRIRLHDSPMQRLFDSMDICQSVMANFLVRASAGQFELERPEQVLGLLVKMARHKLTDKARAQHGPRRHPGGQQQEGSAVIRAVTDPAASPSRILQGKELLDRIRQHLTAEEATLLEYRAQGLQWPEIAAKLNAKPDAVRKQFTRAVDRVVEELGAEDWLA
jgi:RNA polymerase sigma-70 factor (ECF subfamily)